jgi:hypothetical protein
MDWIRAFIVRLRPDLNQSTDWPDLVKSTLTWNSGSSMATNTSQTAKQITKGQLL